MKQNGTVKPIKYKSRPIQPKKGKKPKSRKNTRKNQKLLKNY